MSRYQTWVAVAIGEEMRRFGFSLADGARFKRRVNDVIHSITFAPEKKRDGIVRMIGGCGIRIPAVEELWRPNPECAHLLTVGVPVHFLRHDRRLSPWCFRDHEELILQATTIVRDIEVNVLPFFQRFPNSGAVFEALKKDGAENWFTCDQDRRNALLVYLALLNRGIDEAVTLGEALLEPLRDKPPKSTVELTQALIKARESAAPPS